MTAFTAQHKILAETRNDLYCAQSYAHDNFFVSFEICGDGALPKAMAFLEVIKQSLLSHPPQTLTSFKELLSIAKTNYPTIIFAAGLIIERVLYVATTTGGTVYIARKQKAIRIAADASSASGLVTSNDLLLFTTADFNQIVTEVVVFELLINGSLVAVSEAFFQILRNTHQMQGAALLVSILPSDAITSGAVAFKPISNKQRVQSGIAGKISAVTHRMKMVKPIGIAVFVLVLFLIGSIYVGLVKNRTNSASSVFVESLDEITHKFDEGLALIDLNPIRARQLLAEAKAKLSEQQKNPLSENEQKILGEYITKIDAGLVSANRSFEVPLTPFFEFSLLKKNGEGTHMSLYQDILIILDSANSSLYRLSISSKAAKLLASSQLLKNAVNVAVYGEEIYVYADGIYRLSTTAGLEQIISKDTEILHVSDIAAFSGNLYVLDKGRNWIWKYMRGESGFESRQDYLLFDTIVDLSKATNISIDGSVWVVHDGKIKRFTQGKEDVWSIKGLHEPLGVTVDMYVDELTKYAYVLDVEHKRVVVLDKDGTYLAQYHWEEALYVSDFVVSEQLHKILLLSRGTIYGIDLK